MVAKINRIDVVKKFKKPFLAFCMVAVFAFGAKAERSILTDDETETLLQNIVKPIFEVAGVAYDKNKIHLLNDMSLNAFVTDGNHLFVHTGTILKASNVNEISGILAHETGHIAGGHVMRQKLKINDLQTLSVISLLAAGATAVASGRGDAAMAIALGSHGSMLNSMMAYQTTEERNADESAVTYLKALNQSPEGLKNFMKTIQQTNRLSGYEESPYFRTHPMSVERMSFFETSAKQSGGKLTSPYDEDFAFVQAKLTAFLLPIEQVLRKYPSSTGSLQAKYAQAIVFLRQKQFNKALTLADELIAAKPQNPYFYQLKGQILFESGKATQSAAVYEKALEIKPKSDEIMLAYAESALEAENHQKNLQHIIDVLTKLQHSRENTHGWELLSKAYYEKGMKADSMYALAKYSLATDRFETAEKQIKEARTLNPSNALTIKLNDLESELKKRQKDKQQ